MLNPDAADENHRIVIESSRKRMLHRQFTGTAPRHRVHPLLHLFHPRVIITPPSPTEQKLSKRSLRSPLRTSAFSPELFVTRRSIPAFFAYFARGNHIETQILIIYVYTNRSATIFFKHACTIPLKSRRKISVQRSSGDPSNGCTTIVTNRS